MGKGKKGKREDSDDEEEMIAKNEGIIKLNL